MSFWLREVVGWLLVALGIGVFIVCFNLLFETSVVRDPDTSFPHVARTPRIFEVGPLSIIGIVLFRGGIHLLKVAVAARICWRAQENLRGDRAPLPAKAVPARPVALAERSGRAGR